MGIKRELKYPIGEQDFGNIRKSGCVYVDKTRFLEKMIRGGGKYFFLARPRRFGKSLFLSTIDYFFRGERELFRGLHADTMQWEWEEYPILRLDLNISRYEEPGMLDKIMNNLLSEWESKFGVENRSDEMSIRFRNIIKAAHEKTGRQVVILIDEYDKPLAGNLNNNKLFEHYRAKLAGVYANFKSGAEHIRLVFLTGVSRFSKLSVFSDLNNINDISFDNEFADICGITEQELNSNFRPGIDELAARYRVNHEEAHSLLKQNYDGYRFSAESSDIYNPWSLLNCLSKQQIGNYWNETGVPSVLAEMLKRVNANLKKVFDRYYEEDRLKGLDLLNPDPTALLYQTGYLTIKEYNRDLDMYRLGIPNREVRKGILDQLLPLYNSYATGPEASIVSDMVVALKTGEPEVFMETLTTYFAGVQYDLRMDNENNFQNAFYILMSLIGIDTQAETRTSSGRIDLLIKTKSFIYIIELKYDGSAEEALDQIKEKEYGLSFRNDPRTIFLIGVNFSSKTRTIGEWKVESNA